MNIAIANFKAKSVKTFVANFLAASLVYDGKSFLLWIQIYPENRASDSLTNGWSKTRKDYCLCYISSDEFDEFEQADGFHK